MMQTNKEYFFYFVILPYIFLYELLINIQEVENDDPQNRNLPCS